MAHDPTLPNYTRPEAVHAAPDLALMDDLLAGTRRMHERSQHYIRKWTHEDQAVYDIRRTCETVFEGLGRTLSAATGMLFAKPPTITWNGAETAMGPHLDNIDGAGNALNVFAKRFGEAALKDGLGVLLIDHPAPPEDAEGNPIAVTAAVEAEYNLRPRWARYGRSAVINWRVGNINNQSAPTMLVLAEAKDVDDGEFGTKSVQRFRVLRLMLTPSGYQALWQVYEVVDDKASAPEHFKVVDQGAFRQADGKIFDVLPIAVAYTGRTDAMLTAQMPLLGVANANLAHWQIATDLRFNRAVCGFEQMVVTGQLSEDPTTGKPGALRIGPLQGIKLEQGGTAAWISPAGGGLNQLKDAKTEKLTEMAQQGVSFLQSDTRAAETAEAKRLDATAENATLATAAQGIEDALNLALEIHARYLGIAKVDAPVLTLSRDYENTAISAPMLTAWVGAIANAGLPVRFLLQQLQAAGKISAEENIDDLEGEIMANQAAVEAAKAEAEAERVPAIVPPVGDPLPMAA
jgi:hypothetical protein